jgi:hypothetical protein
MLFFQPENLVLPDFQRKQDGHLDNGGTRMKDGRGLTIQEGQRTVRKY